MRACHIASGLARDAITIPGSGLIVAAVITRRVRTKVKNFFQQLESGGLILACAPGTAGAQQYPPLESVDD
ncbi:MAG TPA: hypothetical protein VGQ88_02940 [Burkholderiales bacterium]|nr:hypothetical protein [Burkholderiales bacterium]